MAKGFELLPEMKYFNTMLKSQTKNDEVLFLVDESYKNSLGLVCIVCIQGQRNLKLVRDQIRQISIDPTINTYRDSSILHYVDDDISARQSLVPWIIKMPISVYVAVTKVDMLNSKQAKDTAMYSHIFPEIFKPVKLKFSKRLSQNIHYHVKFENLTDKPSQDLIFFKEVVGKISDHENTDISVVRKNEEPLIFLPDYFLGFIGDKLSEENKWTWPTNSLKLLSQKIGLILLFTESKPKRYRRGEEIYKFLS